MRNFTVEDFSGAGQYLIRMTKEEIYCRENNKPFIVYPRWINLSTIMYKVGYINNNFKIGNGEQLITLTSMSDGHTVFNHYPNREKAEQYRKEGKEIDFDEWEKCIWQNDDHEIKNGWQKFVDYLNFHSQEMRFATQEEIVLCVLKQTSRWRNL